jgi:hypothetical protein
MKPVITPELAEVLDVLQSDRKPDRAAMENLKLLGSGGYARVYEHPSDPELVVRVAPASKFDAWFVYAESLVDGNYWMTQHGPSLRGMAYMEVEGRGCWVGIAERLKKIDDEFSDLYDTMRAVGRYVNPEEYGDCELEDEDLLHERPGLPEFLDRYCRGTTDFHRDNFLLRGDALVVNDPSEYAEPEEFERLKALYHIDGRPRLEPEMTAAGGMMP